MEDVSKSEARENRILVNTEIEAHGKKPLIAYLLWFFLGNFGGHRFYFGKIGTASLQLFLAVAGYLTVWFFLGFLFLIPLWIWVIVDVFLINSMIRENHNQLERNVLATL